MSRKLYEIVDSMRMLEDLLENLEEGSTDFDEVNSYLDSVDVELATKVENIMKYIQNLRAEADMYKTEKMRLEALQRSANKKADNLEKYLKDSLQAIGYNHKNKKKIETSIGKIGFRKNPATIEILNPEVVLEHFPELKKEQPLEFNKKELLKAIKEEYLSDDAKNSDEVILSNIGVKYVNDSSHLRIN